MLYKAEYLKSEFYNMMLHTYSWLFLSFICFLLWCQVSCFPILSMKKDENIKKLEAENSCKLEAIEKVKKLQSEREWKFKQNYLLT